MEANKIRETYRGKIGHFDAKALLLGKGAEVSDAAVKAILSSCNINEAELAKIMSDPALVSDLKQKLALQLARIHLVAQVNHGYFYYVCRCPLHWHVYRHTFGGFPYCRFGELISGIARFLPRTVCT
jgi:hypothetical protein